MDQKIWYLKKLDIFANLTKQELNYIDKNSKMISVSKGETIYTPVDSEKDFIYFLKSGAVKLLRTDDSGKELIYAVLTANEVFGGLLQTEKKGDEFAEAIENSLLCKISKEIFFSFVNKKPALIIKLNKLLGLKVYELELLIEHLVFKPVLSRLACLLLSLTKKFGKRTGNSILIDIHLTHNELASMIGATRETTTMSLTKLKSMKIVEIKGKRIFVSSMDKLNAMVTCE